MNCAFGNQFHILPGGGTVKSTGFKIAGDDEVVYLTDVPREDGRFGDMAIFKPALN